MAAPEEPTRLDAIRADDEQFEAARRGDGDDTSRLLRELAEHEQQERAR